MLSSRMPKIIADPEIAVVEAMSRVRCYCSDDCLESNEARFESETGRKPAESGIEEDEVFNHAGRIQTFLILSSVDFANSFTISSSWFAS